MSQLASWAMGTRLEVALLTADGGEGKPVGPAGKVRERAPPPLFHVVKRDGDHIMYCPNCDTFEEEEGMLLTTWAAVPTLWMDCKGLFNPCSASEVPEA